MQPFSIRVDWTCHDAYPGDPVVVELWSLDENGYEEMKELAREQSIPRAVDYAIRWFKGRGIDYSCNISYHQSNNHKHITLHPRPPVEEVV